MPAGCGVPSDNDARDRAWPRVSHGIADSNHKQSRETGHSHAFLPYVGSSPPCFVWLVVAPYLISEFGAGPHYHQRNF